MTQVVVEIWAIESKMEYEKMLTHLFAWIYLVLFYHQINIVNIINGIKITQVIVEIQAIEK
jgi:hypothetical protein